MASYCTGRSHHKAKLTDETDPTELLKEIERLNTQIATMQRFVQGAGYTFSPAQTRIHSKCSFGHPALKPCPVCGAGTIMIVEDVTEAGAFLAQCKNCSTRTESAKYIPNAIRDWNNRKLTEMSQVMNTRLTAQTMNTDGARSLVAAIGKQAASDYRESVKAGKPSKVLENFFDGIYIGGKPAVDVMRQQAEQEMKHDEEP